MNRGSANAYTPPIKLLPPLSYQGPDHMAANRKAEVEAAQKALDLKNKKYQLELDTTQGKILLDMFADVAPVT